jgi:hypothetical protein
LSEKEHMRGRATLESDRPHLPGYGSHSDGGGSVTGTALVFGTGPRSRKALNISMSLRLVAHLESGDDVVIFSESQRRRIAACSLPRTKPTARSLGCTSSRPAAKGDTSLLLVLGSYRLSHSRARYAACPPSTLSEGANAVLGRGGLYDEAPTPAEEYRDAHKRRGQ